jgi:hypothetical protein
MIYEMEPMCVAQLKVRNAEVYREWGGRGQGSGGSSMCMYPLSVTEMPRLQAPGIEFSRPV